MIYFLHKWAKYISNSRNAQTLIGRAGILMTKQCMSGNPFLGKKTSEESTHIYRMHIFHPKFATFKERMQKHS